MKELLEKLSSYNLFNYLLPGVIFSVIATNYTGYSLVQYDIFIGVFVYYFIGLIISRFGSLIIEPILKKVSFLKFAPYEDFVTSSKVDDKLDILSEVNNTYRTFSSMFLLLLILKLYEIMAKKMSIFDRSDLLVLILILFVTFIFSYRKQTKYITNRIEALKNSLDDET